MKAIILQENLNKGFSIVSRTIGSKTTLPILNNVLISAAEGKVKLTATNLETGINIWLPAKIEKSGKFTVPAKDLAEFISSLPAEKIELEKQQEKLKLTCASYRAVFNGMSAAEFPVVPSLRGKNILSKKIKKFELEAEEFINAVNYVCFAAAIDETRPVLTGVRLSCIEKELQFVATDGYRLSLKKIKLKKEINIPTLIIPAKTLTEVARIISGESKGGSWKSLGVAIVEDSKQVVFSYNDIEVAARLIEGEFPDFSKIIPEKGETKLLIERESFDRAIKTCSIFARKSANIIKLKVSEGGKSSAGQKGANLYVMANAPEVGENEIGLLVNFQGKEAKIAFNHRFLQDFVNNFNEDVFVLELSGALKPGMFRSEKKSSFLHIIMPVRLQEN